MAEAHTKVDGTPMRQHVLALDGVRGLAIALILAYHLMHANPARSQNLIDYLQKLPGGMWIGVDLFFVLSGFLITGILFDSLGDGGFFGKFYGRRALRIFPLYYGVLLLLILFTGPLKMAWAGREWALLLYLQNTPLFAPLLDYDTFSPFITISHLWSLAVEEQFYLVWPLVVFFVRDLRRLLMVALVGAALALLLRTVLTLRGVDVAVVYVSTFCRADSLLLGAALALAMRTAWRGRVLAAANAVMVLAAVPLITIAWHQGDLRIEHGILIRTVGLTLLALGSAGLIASAFKPRSVLRRLFELRPMRFLGRYSYGIYIFHFPLDHLLTGRIRVAMAAVIGSKLISGLGSSALVALLSIGLAVLSFQLYERRFLRLKRFLAYDPETRALEGSHGEPVTEGATALETTRTRV